MHLFRLNNGTRDNLCPFDESIFGGDLRLLLVGILGSSVSIISVLQNVLLFYVFSTSRKLRRQNYVNPVLLALFDSLVSLIYLSISPVHFLAHRLASPALTALWARHLPVLYCLEHFALTVCNLLLVVASLERFLANGPLYSQKSVLIFIVRNKPYVIMTILAFAFLLKATLYFEIGLCTTRSESINIVPIWLADHASLFQSLRFWTRNFLTVILPFLILAYCNCRIVQQLRKRRRMNMSGSSHAEYSGSVITQTQSVNQIAENKCQQNLGNRERNAENRKLNNVKSSSDWRSNLQLIPNGGTTAASGLLEPTAIVRNIHNGHQKQPHRTRVHILKGTEQRKCANCLAVNSKSSKSIPPKRVLVHTATTASANTISSPNSSFGVRVATRTLVMVVGCYLISNSMSTLLNFWEYFDLKFLRHDNFRAYLVASDIAALLTICGCALRLPIYVSNDKRIRKAICRALIRFRFCCTKSKPDELVRGEEAGYFLEKYSIVIVSNSLRSNLTGMLSQCDWGTFQGKRSFDQLAILVQNRRKFLVQMTINLGAVHEMENDGKISKEEEEKQQKMMKGEEQGETDGSAEESMIG